MISFFTTYINNETIFSSRYLALFLISLLLILVSLIRILRNNRKEIKIRFKGIDIIYIFILAYQIKALFSEDYRTKVFAISFIASISLYFCIRVNYRSIKKIFQPFICQYFATLLIIIHFIIALVMYLKDGGQFASTFKNSNCLACYETLWTIILLAIDLYGKQIR